MTNIFSSKPAPVVNKIVYLEQKSESAISVFKKTLDDLNFINEEVDNEIINKESEILAIKDDIAVLSERQIKNKNFISKLQEFFE